MADARPHEASPRRLLLARRSGQVAYSRELPGACAALALVATLALGGARWASAPQELLRHALQLAGDPALPLSSLAGRAVDTAWAMLAWPLTAVLVAAALAGFAQVGPLFRWPLGASALARSRLRAPFHAESLWDLALVALRWAAIALVGWSCVRSSLRGVFALPFGDPVRAFGALTELALRFVAVTAIAWFALGLVDLWVAHLLHRRRLRMTEREWRQDLRESHGDPEIRARRAAALARARLALSLAELGRAELLLLDGRGRALALGRPSNDAAAAPAVLAHATGPDAERMRQRALQLGLRVAVDPSLVAALSGLELTEPIAPEHYRRVARHMV